MNRCGRAVQQPLLGAQRGFQEAGGDQPEVGLEVVRLVECRVGVAVDSIQSGGRTACGSLVFTTGEFSPASGRFLSRRSYKVPPDLGNWELGIEARLSREMLFVPPLRLLHGLPASGGHREGGEGYGRGNGIRPPLTGLPAVACFRARAAQIRGVTGPGPLRGGDLPGVRVRPPRPCGRRRHPCRGNGPAADRRPETAVCRCALRRPRISRLMNPSREGGLVSGESDRCSARRRCAVSRRADTSMSG